MALRDNLVSWWSLDEASGSRADSHGTNTLTANGTGGVGSAAGIISNAADFEFADTDYLSIADASQSGLDITGDLSVSTWINLESTPGSGVDYGVVSKWNGGASQASYLFYVRNQSGTLGMYATVESSGSPGGPFTGKNFTFSTATWYHLVWVYTASAGSIEFYINGASQGTNTGHDTSIFNSTAAFEIGSYNAGVANFDGLIDETAIWSRAITSGEVSQLYNSGSGLSYAGTASVASFIPKATFL